MSRISTGNAPEPRWLCGCGEAVALALTLAACSQPSFDDEIARARRAVADQEPATAVVAARAALALNPDAAEARYLFAVALLDSGDPQSAITEFHKAADLNHSINLVVPQHARAVLQTGENAQLIARYGNAQLPDRQAQADLLTSLAQAHYNEGAAAQATALLESALTLRPDFVDARVLSIRLAAAAGGDIARALGEVESLLRAAPSNASALLLKGDLLGSRRRDVDGALAAYRAAIKSRPRFLNAHGGALNLLLESGDPARAREQWNSLRALLPAHPQTRFYDARIALLERRYERVRELVAQLLKVAPDDVRALYLGGVAALERRASAEAIDMLTKALARLPAHDASRRALVVAYLQAGRADLAQATGEPLTSREQPMADDLMLAARTRLSSGDFAGAQALFRRASIARTGDARSKLALAVAELGRGSGAAAIQTLEELAAADGADPNAGTVLVFARLQRGEVDAARAAASRLATQHATDTAGPMLLGQIALGQGDRSTARASFSEALRRRPKFMPAVAALAGLDEQDGRLDAAEARFREVVEREPENVRALMRLADLRGRQSAEPQEVLTLLDRCIRLAPAEAGPRVTLVNYLRSRGDVQAALTSARQAAAALPDDQLVQAALADAEAGAGNVEHAVSALQKLAVKFPGAAWPLLKRADIIWDAGQKERALEVLRAGLARSPDSPALLEALARRSQAAGQTQEALGLALSLQRKHPKLESGYLIAGSLATARRDHAKAVAAYRAGVGALPDSASLAVRLFAALIAAGKPGAAGQHGTAWLARHPKDTQFRTQHGDHLLMQGAFAPAEAQYRQVLEIDPNHLHAMNNVAWLMARAKRPGAVDLARRVVAQDPGDPSKLDTLAFALASEARHAEAVATMFQAIGLAPQNPLLRFSLAQYAIEAGDRKTARTELQKLARLGSSFPKNKRVKEMLADL